MEVLLIMCMLVVPALAVIALRSKVDEATREAEKIEAAGGVPCGVSCGLLMFCTVLLAVTGAVVWIGTKLPLVP